MDAKLDAVLDAARAAGFTYAQSLDARVLEPRPEVRAMCAADKCRRYGKSWACPPACASLETLGEKIKGYRRGILVQTVVRLEDSFDFEAMMAGEAAHTKAFEAFIPQALAAFPQALPMGAGTCMRCQRCTYPDAPCRFPELVFPSMEACGLVVSDVCTRSGLKYYYGPNTVAFTSCCLTD